MSQPQFSSAMSVDAITPQITNKVGPPRSIVYEVARPPSAVGSISQAPGSHAIQIEPPRGFPNHINDCRCILCRVTIGAHRVRLESWVVQNEAFVSAGTQSPHSILRQPFAKGRNPPEDFKDFFDHFVFESSLRHFRNWFRELEDVALMRYHYEMLREFGRVLGTDEWLKREEVIMYERVLRDTRGWYEFFLMRMEAQNVAVNSICGEIARLGPDAEDRRRLANNEWDGAPATRSKAFNEERIMSVPDKMLSEDLEDDFSDCEGSEYDFFSGGIKAEVLDRVTPGKLTLFDNPHLTVLGLARLPIVVPPEIRDKSEYAVYPEEWPTATPTETRKGKGRPVLGGRVEKRRSAPRKKPSVFLASVRALDMYSLRHLPARRLSRNDEVRFERLSKLEAIMHRNAEISMKSSRSCFY